MRGHTTHDDGMAISARRLAMNDVSHSTENIMYVVLYVEVPHLCFELLFIDLNVYVLSVRTMLTFAPVLWFVMRATDDL